MPRRNRDHQVVVRLDDEEREILDRLSTNYGVTRSDILRQALRHYEHRGHL